MAAISITAANVAFSAAAVHRVEFTAGATITQGQGLYKNSSNQWALTDMNGNLGTGIADLRGIAASAAALGQPIDVVTYDPDWTVGGTVSTGLPLYGSSATPGGISFADIPTTGDYTIIWGVAKSATKAILNPMAPGVII